MSKYPSHSIVHYYLPTFFLFSFLFSHVAPSVAVLCSDRHPDGPPNAADCHYILAHLPSLPSLGNNTLSDPHANDNDLDPSSPFSPNALFLYHSCVIVFDVCKFTNHGGVPMDLTESDVMEAWTRMRQDTARVIDECVNTDRIGVAVDEIRALAVYYSVHVHNFHEATILRGKAQLWAMEKPEETEQKNGVGYRRRFWDTIYFL